MDAKKIDLDLLPGNEWPSHLRQEVGIAQLMFDCLAEAVPNSTLDLTLLAYMVAFHEGARRLFFVQDAMNAGGRGKDGVERLAITSILDGADEIVMVSEAWMVRSDERDLESVRRWLAEHGSLREHPDVVERLTVNYHDLSGDIMTAAEIHRSTDGSRLVDWTAQRQVVERGQGRFQNWFLKAASFGGGNN